MAGEVNQNGNAAQRHGHGYTRQLTTVLSVDVVGYAKMMGQSEENTLDQLVECRGVIEAACTRAGGRLFGVAGDSMMVEFGSPVDAILAALDFQERIASLELQGGSPNRMTFRAGVNTGDVIARDGALFGDEVNIAARLQEIAAPGGLVISATAYHHASGRVAAEFVDLGERALKHISTRVHAYAVSRAGKTPEVAPVAGLAMGATPAAVAVLPFSIDDSVSDLAYLGDGLADDIIAGLSGTRWLPVISKSSSFQFRDTAVGTVTAAHSLGARYVVSGSVRRHDGSLTVKAVLEDSATALVLWSRRFDHPADQAGELIEKLGIEIVATLEKQVGQAEMIRAFRTPWEQPETWKLVQRGRWHMHRRTREDTAIAHDLFIQALAADANSAMALNELAWWHIWRAWHRIGDTDELDRVTHYAGKALFMDSQDARPHCWLGVAEILRGNAKAALDYLDEAVRLNPSFAFAHSASGTALVLAAAPGDAIPRFLQARRLSPFDLYGFHNVGELAAARLLTGDFAGSLEAAQRSMQLSPRYIYASIIAMTALWKLDRREEARKARMQFDALLPDFNADRIVRIPFKDQTYASRLLEGYVATGS